MWLRRSKSKWFKKVYDSVWIIVDSTMICSFFLFRFIRDILMSDMGFVLCIPYRRSWYFSRYEGGVVDSLVQRRGREREREVFAST
jgi:hypothetical protein